MSMEASDAARARKNLINNLAKWLITTFGIGTIACVFLIIIVIFIEVLPLFQSAGLNLEVAIPQQKESNNLPIAAGVGSWNEKVWLLRPNGELVFIDVKTKEEIKVKKLREGQKIKSVSQGSNDIVTIIWDDDLVTREDIKINPVFDAQGKRSILIKHSASVKQSKLKSKPIYSIARVFTEDSETVETFFSLCEDGSVYIEKIEKVENFLGELVEERSKAKLDHDAKVLRIASNLEGLRFYTLDEESKLTVWNSSSSRLKKLGSSRLSLKGRVVKGMKSLVGDEEFVIYYKNGDVEIYALALNHKDEKKPVKTHELENDNLEISNLVSSPRNRTIVYKTNLGSLASWYTTSERHLYDAPLEKGERLYAFSKRGLTLLSVSPESGVRIWEVDAPHPEMSYSALFSKVWYSGYKEPEYAWQSSSGSDDFEPKMSLVPLIYGSLKGALYAMFFSVPFALLAALYTSVFASSKVKDFVKPIVEMMSAVPSVVVGFLGALWLAPIIDGNLLAVFLYVPVFLVFLIILVVIMSRSSKLERMSPILTLAFSVGVLVISCIVSDILSQSIDSALFAGQFKQDFVRYLDGHYDMRNSLIIAFALGFAVIPIVYTISEDAFSSVPKGLSSASLALGATPWQTAWRIILPAASPGVFAAISLGLGRAVGETMIVLMATGNTPIMEYNIFEGFRALSANIAVEIPEAPKGGTLYRVLFLSAGVLLLFTSVLNTLSETVRQNLSKKFSRF